MIINISYFVKGDLYIPNAINSNPGFNNSIEADLNEFIAEYEKELLLNVLGVTLYNELESSVSAGAVENTAPQKWKDLVNGKEYTYEDRQYKWQGFKPDQNLLAYYVYCKYLLNDEIQYTTTGMNTGEGGASYQGKYVHAWNKFIDKYQQQNAVESSLYQYLMHHQTDFPDIDFPLFHYENSLGL